MLQMNCPKCKKLIKSPFLAELSTIECVHCKDSVAVKDVFVKTKSFMIHRDDLLNRIYRYQTLLQEVEKERLLLAKSGEISATTQKNIENFSATLQELLIGARKNFRLEVPSGLSVEIACGSDVYAGRLVNLSTEGASVEFDMLDNLPKNGSAIKMKWQLPEVSAPLSATANVVWQKKLKGENESHLTVFGVKFVRLDEDARSFIWNFIADTASAPVA